MGSWFRKGLRKKRTLLYHEVFDDDRLTSSFYIESWPYEKNNTPKQQKGILEEIHSTANFLAMLNTLESISFFLKRIGIFV